MPASKKAPEQHAISGHRDNFCISGQVKTLKFPQSLNVRQSLNVNMHSLSKWMVKKANHVNYSKQASKQAGGRKHNTNTNTNTNKIVILNLGRKGTLHSCAIVYKN